MADNVDASMESTELKTAEVQPVDIATFVNDAVFNEVEKLSKDPQNGVAAPTEMKEVVKDERAKAEMKEGFPSLQPRLEGAIIVAYSVPYTIACTVAKTVVANTKTQFGRKQHDVKMSVELIDQMRDAFTTTEYIGDAPVKFANYLWRCWKAYNPEKYKAPYVAVVQSSGFGKSRMLFELACQAKHGDTDEVDECWKHMRVLYTCVRSHESSGFPQKTESLRGWLFPDSDANVADMAHCLKQIYYHAEANWTTVQTEWISLFTHGGADAAIKKALEKTEIKKSSGNSDAKQKNPENSKMVVLVVLPLASRAVADFMAILAYVNYVREGYLSSYASDPILALGAMKVWYTESSALPMYILPQLKKLILDEALDTGGIGEMVARILLLLAMDKCAMAGKSVVDCTLKGRFVSVGAFLRELEGGEDLAIFQKGMKSAVDTKAFKAWRAQWKDWQLRFTHFVQLQFQPNEDTLWYLLGRRAAGIFPRNQDGADLLIPIFWRKPISTKSTMETVDGADEAKMEMDDDMLPEECPQEKVSFILIQVESRSPTDSGFTQSETRKLSPWFTFKPQANPLSKKGVHEVIRIYMNLRDTNISTRSRDCYKFIYATSLEDNNPKPKAGKQKKNGEPKDTTQAEGKAAKEDTNSTDVEPKQKKQKREGEDVQMEDAQASGEANVKVQKRKRPVVAEAQGATAPIESKAENSMFTYCFRSLCCETYPFLETGVANSLKTMVDSLWYPMGLVDGDLEQRHRIEETSFSNCFSRTLDVNE